MILTEEIPLSQHDVLDAADCDRASETTLSLREHWTQRSPAATFFTLGAASYLDASKSQPHYLELARASNPMLERNFGWLHEKVKSFFEELLGERAFYDHTYALPGFHVFVMSGADRSGDRPANRAHFDLQFMHAIPGIEPKGTLSFTLPVNLPTGGSSMEIWPARYQDAIRRKFTALEYAAEHPSQTVEYVPGRIVVHDGMVLHAIGGSSTTRPSGYRITLQGHGVKMPEGWLLYW
jgi:hypothetical protein